MSDLSPALNTGVTEANFHTLGTISFFIDKLTKYMIGDAKASLCDFIKLVSSP